MNRQALPQFESIEAIRHGFDALGYICSDRIATTVFLAFQLGKPVLVEGPPGVGKTELAKTASALLSLPLIRLQCYEGLDEAKALYEWKYGKQLLYTQILKEKLGDLLQGADDLAAAVERLHAFGDIFYSEAFLEPRPLLTAMQQEEGAILLIDEIDKADYEFESLLLEVLSDFQVSIPEIGTVRARSRPMVFLTSNNTREISDALKRRCLHLYIPFPSLELEERIVQSRVPGIDDALRRQLVAFVHSLRELDLRKTPAISETIDWARSLLLLHADALDAQLVRDSLGTLLKFEQDIEAAQAELGSLLDISAGRH
ncbi:AAA family ATPase [Chromatocurvus halotolerans]|uniref:MoxR-like ATPase n=1 Tax=Chromatocurvus halotolerans TaxID=1132028 RepID=A0A4V2SBX4_9GAMM|nr:MoxR family ATPase [Chromatocurvus halotolerans]TCO77240.1 MoxR-like ATPase [Chromatocurvus halotolerans]